MLKLLVIFTVGVAVGTWPAPAVAQLRPATAEGLGGAIGTCLAVTAEPGPIEERLVERDWVIATINPPPTEDAPNFFGSADSEAMILTNGPSDNGNEACTIIAHIDSILLYRATEEGLSRAFGQPREEEPGQSWWEYDGRVANFALTGSQDNLGVRFTVLNSNGAD